ncbi:MAG: mechanosensitive ion channel family protein [Magnetospiraceae bacterium]
MADSVTDALTGAADSTTNTAAPVDAAGAEQSVAIAWRELWLKVMEVWEFGVFGVDVGKFAVALCIFIGFLLIRGLLTTLITRVLYTWVAKIPGQTDDRILDAIAPPLRFVPVVMGVFFATQYMELEGGIAFLVEKLVLTLIAFTIFWALYRAMDPLTVVIHRLERFVTPEIVDWVSRATKGLIIFVGGASILEIWGIQIAPLLAGLGLFGVAVALGAQDLFKNLISGMLILVEKRFKKGDWVLVDGVVEGTVESIGFRSTVVRRFDKAPVYVPNSKLSDTAVTNFSEMTYRRIYWLIGVEYRTSIDQLRQIRDGIEQYVLNDKAFVAPTKAATFVRIDRFSDSSIDIMLYCFTRTTNWGKWLEIKEQLAYRIMEIVEGAGAGFAFPSQSLYIETVPGERPEPFTPPSEKAISAPAET